MGDKLVAVAVPRTIVDQFLVQCKAVGLDEDLKGACLQLYLVKKGLGEGDTSRLKAKMWDDDTVFVEDAGSDYRLVFPEKYKPE